MTNEELIARLRSGGLVGISALIAADRFEALVKRLGETETAFLGQLEKAIEYEFRAIESEARASELEKELDYANKRLVHAFERNDRQAQTIDDLVAITTAASAIVDDVCSYICPSVGKAGAPIPHDPRCIALRTALTLKETTNDRD